MPHGFKLYEAYASERWAPTPLIPSFYDVPQTKVQQILEVQDNSPAILDILRTITSKDDPILDKVFKYVYWDFDITDDSSSEEELACGFRLKPSSAHSK